MKPQNRLSVVILLVSVFFLVLTGIFVRITFGEHKSPDTTEPFSTEDVENPFSASSAGTEPTVLTEPTVPTEPIVPTEPTFPTEPTVLTEPTVPTDPTVVTEPTYPTYPTEIPAIYSREELEAMENVGQEYGPGNTSGGKRPPYADPLQKQFADLNVNFIAPDNGEIYLTFDCGYEYTATDENGAEFRVTERILDVLNEKDVKAVFFVTMHYVKENPDLVRRMIDEGHSVGNHTQNHPIMTDCSIDKMVYEIMSLHDYVKQNFHYQMNLFRFPTGKFSTRTLAVVQNLGYKSVHWSFAYRDYEPEDQMSPDEAYQKVTESHHSGAIYLLHTISTTNAEILGDVIDFLRAEGYTLQLFQ